MKEKGGKPDGGSKKVCRSDAGRSVTFSGKIKKGKLKTKVITLIT